MSDFDRYRPSASSSRTANAPISPATPKSNKRIARGCARAAATKPEAIRMSRPLTKVPITTNAAPRKKNFGAAEASPASMNCGRKVTKNRMIFGFVMLMSNAGQIGLGQARRGAIARLAASAWRHGARRHRPATGDRTPLRFAARRKGARRRRSARKGRRPRRKYGRGRQSSRPRGLRNRGCAHRSGSSAETGPCQGRASPREERRRRNRRGVAGRRGGRTTRGTPQTRM